MGRDVRQGSVAHHANRYDAPNNPCAQNTSRCGHLRPQRYRFATGTGTPAIFTLTAPNSLRVVKYSVFQSAPPKARLVVAEAPCTIRPSFLPFASITHNPPGPPQ